MEYTESCFPKVSMLFCNGVLGVSSSRIMRKSSPNCDRSPVDITIPMPFPPEKRAKIDFTKFFKKRKNSISNK